MKALVKSLSLISILALSYAISSSSFLYAQQQEQQLLLHSDNSGQPVNISNSSGDPNSPAIATFGDNVYAVWVDYDNSTPGAYDIYFARSTDGGSSFTEPTNLSQNLGNSVTPAIATYGNNVFVVWSDNEEHGVFGNDYEILLKWSADGGATFSTDAISVSNNNGDSSDPTITASENSNKIYIAWLDNIWCMACTNATTAANNNDYSIHFTSASTDDIVTGVIGSQPVELVNNATSPPEIAAFETNVYLVWPNNPSLINSTSTASSQVTESASPSSFSSSSSPQFQDIFFTASRDGGLSFNSPINLSNNNGTIESSDAPDIDVSATNGVYVVWHQLGIEEADQQPYQEIYITRSEDGGISFGKPINVSNNAGVSDLPAVAAFVNMSSNGLVYVGWKEDPLSSGNTTITSGAGASSNILLASSRSGTQPMNFSFGYSDRPDVDFSFNDDVYVVWEDIDPLSGPNIFLARLDAEASAPPPAASPGADQTATTTNNNVSTLTQQVPFLPYENFDFGFQVQYPSGWEIIESEDVVAFGGSSENLAENEVFPEQVGIIHFGDLPVDISVDDVTAINEYLSSLPNDFVAQFPDYEVVDGPTQTTLDGNPAQQIIIRDRINQWDVMEIWTTQNGRVFQIEISVQAGLYSTFPPPHIQHMLDSLDITY